MRLLDSLSYDILSLLKAGHLDVDGVDDFETRESGPPSRRVSFTRGGLRATRFTPWTSRQP